MAINILIVDDDANFREAGWALLTDAGYEATVASCPDEAYSILMGQDFDLVLCDLYMPFTTGEKQDEYVTSFEVGVRTIRELAGAMPRVPIVALSSIAPCDLKRLSKYLDPVPAYCKPVRPGEMLALVENVLDFGRAPLQ